MNTPSDKPTIGVLSLQGAFREHVEALESLGANAVKIRRRRELSGIDGLVIPGGESTTIGKLIVSYHMLDPLRELGSSGLPIFGTCAGLVMLARDLVEHDQPLLGLMNITARRNAFGRQVKSFEAELDIPELGGEYFPGIFIRAPWIEQVGNGVEVLATHEGHSVAARQDNMLATAFHPELTGDLRLHQLFLEMVGASR